MENKRKWIFIGYAVLILMIPAYIIGSSENILSNGKLYKFQMRGKDPIDFFRGNFLTVRIDTRGIPTDKSDWKGGEEVYLTIDVDEDGFAYFDEALPEPPKKGDYMVSRVVRWWDVSNLTRGFDLFGGGSDIERQTVDVEMPNNLGKYFINEEFALDGEYVIGNMRRESYVGVRVKNGNVRLEDIYIDKKPLMKFLEDNDVDSNEGFSLFGF